MAWLHRRRVCAVAAAIGLVVASRVAPGADDVWKSAIGGGTWEISTNWLDNSAPTNSDTANFNSAGTYDVRLDQQPESIQNLSVSAGQVTLSAAGVRRTLTISGGTEDLDVSGGGKLVVGRFLNSVVYPVTLNVGDAIHVAQGSTLEVRYGSLLTANQLGDAPGFNGNILVDHPGAGTRTSLALTSLAQQNIGANGGAGSIVYQSSSMGSFAGGVGLGTSGAGSNGSMTLHTGADVSIGGNLLMAAENLVGQTATLNIDGASSSLTLGGAAGIVVGSASNGSATINVAVATNSGSLITGTGGLTIRKTGFAKINSTGSLVANGDILVDGGRFQFVDGTTLTLAGGRNLTAQNDAIVNGPSVGGTYTLGGGSTFIFESGSDFSISAPFIIGGISDGTMIVRGPGSTFSVPTAVTTYVGRTSATGVFRFEDGASGNIKSRLGIADSGTVNSRGVLSITGGSTVELSNFLTIANQNLAGQVGNLIIEGEGSLLNISGNFFITVGSAANGSALMNIGVGASGGALTTGTGQLTIAKTGIVNVGTAINSGVLNANGNILIDGGSLVVGATGNLNLASGRMMTLQAGGVFEAHSAMQVLGTSNITINSGSAILHAGLNMSDQSILTLNGNGRVTLSSGAGAAHFGYLIIAGTTNTWSGILDVSDNSVVIESSDVDVVLNQIKTGLTLGKGIISTAAASPFRLGAISNNNGTGGAIYKAFQGITGLDGNEVLIRYTRIGDLNLDGTVTISDFIDLAAHFNQTNATWQMGDVNYDGSVTISDFIDLASNFNQSVSGEAMPIGDEDRAMLDSFAAANVPEPGLLAILPLAFLRGRLWRVRAGYKSS